MLELPMRAFKIGGVDGCLEIFITETFGYPEQTSFNGGYDAKGFINIKANKYSVDDGELWFSTGGIYRYFKQLEPCYHSIDGTAYFETPEHDFKMKTEFQKYGHVIISGSYKERPDVNNELNFEFTSDQTQIFEALQHLKNISSIFGDEKGIGQTKRIKGEINFGNLYRKFHK